MPPRRHHSLSWRCRRAGHRLRRAWTPQGVCAECEDDGYLTRGRFCDRDCKEQWRQRQSVHTLATCVYCGEHRRIKYDGRYCSKFCARAHRLDRKKRDKMIADGVPLEQIETLRYRTPHERAADAFGMLDAK